MQRINFEDTTITKQPYVTIDNVDYEVQEGTYQGGTDLDADTFNTLQDNIEEALSNVGGNEIAISETEPTTETTKLWINNGEIGTPASEITNSYSTSTGIGYSANYINNLLKTTIGTMTYNTTYFNTPVFNKISRSGNVVSIYFIAQKKADWSGNADIITGLPANSFGDNFRFSAHIGDDEYIPATTSSRIMLWTQINGTSIRCYNGAIANNKYVHISLTYIAND